MGVVAMSKQKFRAPDHTELVAKWNEANAVGCEVVLTDDMGNKHDTKTRSNAWVLPSGHPVVMVEGRAGGYDLFRIVPKDGGTQ
jgi:hypothetical protein